MILADLKRRMASDPRWVIVAALLLYALILLLPARTEGLRESWWRLNVPAFSPTFLDIRIVLGGFESQRMGFDPLIENPGDPLERPMNYPRLWLLLASTGLGPRHAVPVGLVLAAAFLTCALLVARPRTYTEAVIYSVFYCSPAFMLAIERANIDLVIFSLLAIAVLVPRSKTWVASVPLVAAAAALKLYPIVAIALFLRERQRTFLVIAAGLGVGFLGYLAWIVDDVGIIRATTEREVYYSYGTRVVFSGVDQWRELAGKPGLTSQALTWLPVICGAVVFSLATIAGRRRSSVEPERAVDGFRVGASIFVGTYFLGNNWDYRMIFLALTLPQLLAWARGGALRRVSRATLAAILLSSTSLVFIRLAPEVVFCIEEMVNWALLSMLVYLLTVTRPDWMFRVSAPKRSELPRDARPAPG